MRVGYYTKHEFGPGEPEEYESINDMDSDDDVDDFYDLDERSRYELHGI